jgi:hypothetical protein
MVKWQCFNCEILYVFKIMDVFQNLCPEDMHYDVFETLSEYFGKNK